MIGIRAVAGVFETDPNTVLNWLVEAADHLAAFARYHLRDLHVEQVQMQLARSPFAFPQLVLRRRPASIFDYQFDDFELRDYESHPAIKAPVAV